MPEVKFFDTDLDDSTVSATATITRLTNLGQGVAENSRLGRGATVVGCDWRYSLEMESRSGVGDSAKTCEAVRILLVLDKQPPPDGSVFVSADLFESDTWDAFYNLANQDRFEILFHEDIVMSVTSGAGNVTAYVWGEALELSISSLDLNIPLLYGSENQILLNEISWVVISRTANISATGQFRLRFIG